MKQLGIVRPCAVGEAAGEAARRVLIGSHLGARAHGAVGMAPAPRTAT